MPSFEELEDYKTNLRRGNLTWEGSRMMLPEHKEAIRLADAEEKKVKKHELDPDELEQIGIVVMDALNHTHEVVLNYWKDGHYYDVIGFIDKVSPDQTKVRLEADNGEYQYIEVDCLKSVMKL